MLGRTRIGTAAFARQHEQYLACPHALAFLHARFGNDARLPRHDANHPAGRQQHALRLCLARGAEEDEESDDGNCNSQEQQGQKQMADGPRQQHRAVLLVAQMLDGLLAEQGLDGRRAGCGSRSAGLITQNDWLFK